MTIFLHRIVLIDGAYYYAFLRSISAGRIHVFEAMVFPIGAPILLIPFYYAAWAAAFAAKVIYPAYQPDGWSGLFQSFTALGNTIYVIAGILLFYHVCRILFSRKAAILAGLALWWATSVFYYASVEPFMSHGISFFTVMLFWRVFLLQDRRSTRNHFYLGATAGLMCLARWQNAVWLIAPMMIYVREFACGRSSIKLGCFEKNEPPVTADRRNILTNIILFSTAFILTFSPQLFFWKLHYGAWITIPQGKGFLRFFNIHALDVLFSFNHGLFIVQPVTAMGVIGLLIMLFTHRRSFAVPALLMFALQAIINGTIPDWWGGYNFGPRRFLATLPVVLSGFAYLIHKISAVKTGFRFSVFLTLAFIFINLSAFDLFYHDIWLQYRKPDIKLCLRDQSKLVHQHSEDIKRWADILIRRVGAAAGASSLLTDEKLSLRENPEYFTFENIRVQKDHTAIMKKEGIVEFYDSNGDGPVRLEAVFRSLAADARDGLLRGILNGEPLFQKVISGKRGWLRLNLHSKILRKGRNRLKLFFEIPEKMTDFQIGATGVFVPYPLEIRCTQAEEGYFAEIKMNGINYSKNRRGYNVAIFHPKEGALIESVNFDPFWTNHDDLAEFSRYVESIPEGYVVCIALLEDHLSLVNSFQIQNYLELRPFDLQKENTGAFSFEFTRYRLGLKHINNAGLWAVVEIEYPFSYKELPLFEEYLKRVEPGDVLVICALKRPVSEKFDGHVPRILESLGFPVAFEDASWFKAGIGVKGAEPGTALCAPLGEYNTKLAVGKVPSLHKDEYLIIEELNLSFPRE